MSTPGPKRPTLNCTNGRRGAEVPSLVDLIAFLASNHFELSAWDILAQGRSR